jgi:hypothetical protein
LGTEGKNEKKSVGALLRVTSSEQGVSEISIPWLHLRWALISGTLHFSSVTLQEIHNFLSNGVMPTLGENRCAQN